MSRTASAFPAFARPPEPFLLAADGHMTAAEFASAARAIAETIDAKSPAGAPLILLCRSRGTFIASLCAALDRGRDVLLPHDDTPASRGSLAKQHGNAVCLADWKVDAGGHDGPPLLQVTLQARPASGGKAARLEAAAAMLHFFTSGSTGAPTAHRRRWDALALGGAAWREALALKGRGGIVATVPPQHMYGMEVSVVLPLTSPGIAVWNGQPLYPADVSKALDAITGLRVLATTPVHLSALVRSGIRLPPLHRIVSATSPLTPALARRAEGLWRVPVLDVYGSTETGMVATRRPAHSEIWRPRTDVSLSIDDDVSTVEAPHLDGRISLADRLERADGGFRLFRRNDDLVNVAGKRASLADLNGILQQLPGVTDGAFWMPDDSDPENFGRPVAFVVSDCLDAEAVRQGLRGRIADVFIPRRVIKVSSLPRNATGKLTRAAIDALWQRHNGHPDGDV